MRTLKLVAGVLLVAAAAACGGKSSLPSSPTSPSAGAAAPAPAVSGATIVGSVRTGTSVLADSTGGSAAAAGLTVQISGTNMSTTVGSTGQFTFSGVPAGPVQLVFSGPGVNASVSLTPVASNQTVTITVRVNGSDATLEDESQDDHNTGESEVNGVISGLSGGASSFEFMVGSRLVKGDSQTQFFGDGDKPDSFTNLKNGVRVEVKGTLNSSSVYANRIHVNDSSAPDNHGNGNGTDNGDNQGGNGGDNHDQEAEASGAISGLSGSCPSLSFSLGSQGVQTNSSTTFSGISCSSLKSGDKVEVSGTKQSNGKILAQKVKKD